MFGHILAILEMVGLSQYNIYALFIVLRRYC